MTTIYLVRHGEAEGNLYRRMHGQHNGALTALGERQAKALVPRFRDIHLDAVYASDLCRTIGTAAPLCLSKGLPLYTDRRLREVDVGIWEDKSFGAVKWENPEEYRTFTTTPHLWCVDGSENYETLTDRTLAALEDITARHPDGTVAVFAHGFLIRMLLCRLFFGPVNAKEVGISGNTGVTLLTKDQTGYHLHYKFDVSHLEEAKLQSRGPVPIELRFQPMGREIDQYIKYRKDAWEVVYGSLEGFDGSGFWMDAQNTMGPDPEAMVVAYDGVTPAGMLQLSPDRDAKKGVGYIPFIYLREEYRSKGLGIQLIGQAISFYQRLGRTKLQLSVAPTNTHAIAFYQKYGFTQVGKTRGRFGKLLLMEKNIALPQLPKQLEVIKL